MKNKRTLIKLAAISTVFALDVTLLNIPKQNATEVQATPYTGDYNPYTYDGDYYDTIDFDAEEGMYGSLRTSLTSLIRPAGFYTYGSSGETHLSTQLQYADEDPNNSQNMIYLYTRDSVKKNAASSWNREHVWCQSLSNGNWGQTEGGTDILHLRPTYNSVNSSRGNTPYGDSEHKTKKTYNGMDFGHTGNGFFEPLDCVKGDVARIVMYLWVTYTGYKNYSPLNITSVFQSFNIMLQWHTLDKPDVLEGNRNDYAETSKQKNRNPFVDHPELAWKIFGNESTVSDSVREACIAAYPANGGDPIDPTGIRLSKSTAEITVNRTVQLRAALEPSGATGSVTWSSNNTAVATVSNTGLVTGKSVGNATITATCGSFSASCVITVNEATNNYGTLENPLSIADAIEVISQTGASLTPEPLYIKGVVSSNEAFSTQYNNFGPIWLQSDDGKTAQAFELYRAKLDSSITTNYNAADSLKGKEVVAYGYGKLYNNSIYELCNSDITPTNPLIMSVSAPEATGVTLDRNSIEVAKGGTYTLHATLTPSDSTSLCTWESSDEDVATVENGVVTGVDEGTATITVTVGDDITAECTVTVVDNSGGQGSLSIASSIAAGDTVYLTADAVKMQYAGPSSTSTIYGTAEAYTESPSEDGLALSVVTGSGAGTYAFKLKSGDHANEYLAWSSGNSLRTDADLDANSSWNVSIDSDGNATIANSADSARVIWWNVGSPRFACYTEKSNGASYKYTQLWKTSTTSVPEPEDYLNSAAPYATITGNETTSGTASVTGSITFGSLGLDNGVQYPDPFTLSDDATTITFGGGVNDGKYYSTGAGIRTYGGGYFTIASAGGISRITFTWDGDNKPSSNDVASVGSYNSSTSVWTGSATSVTFTRPSGSGHWRLKSVTATCGGVTVTVDTVKLRFGATISQTDWNTLDTKWGIDDYGIMLVKEATLVNKYHKDSIKEAFLDPNNLALGDVHRGSGAAPTADGGNYLFTAKINIADDTDYNTVYCAAPYIVVDGTYYFLTEIRESVSSLAAKCKDSNLSAAALAILAGD